MAKQLSIIEFDMFNCVLPEEFYDQKWLHKDRDILAPNICAITKRFNWVSLWVNNYLTCIGNFFDCIRNKFKEKRTDFINVCSNGLAMVFY
jgi:hypothetical protein